MDVVRPFRARRRVRLEAALRCIRDHLHKDGAAVIVGNRWPWSHWTGVCNIGKTRLVLADTDGSHCATAAVAVAESAARTSEIG